MIGAELKRRREALGITQKEMGELIRANEKVVFCYETSDEFYPKSAARAAEIMEKIEASRNAGKIGGMDLRLARARKGYSIDDISTITGIGRTTIVHLEGSGVGSQDAINTLFAALGVEGPERFDKAFHAAPAKKVRTKRRKQLDTTASDEAKARLLGISYGTYMAYKDTGYLETFKERQATELHRDEGKNIIESNLIGAGSQGHRTVASVNGVKY